MKRKNFYFKLHYALCFFCAALTLPGFAQKFKGAGTIGGNGEQYVTSICFDQNGNKYAIGVFNGTADLDPGAGTNNITAKGAVDFFVQKSDAAGQLLWTKHFGSPLEEEATDIAVSMAGNIFITGTFQSFLDFDPGPGDNTISTGSPGYNIYVLKLDPNGDLVWAKIAAGPSDEYGKAIAVDAMENVYLAGWFDGKFDLNMSDNAADTAYIEGFVASFITKMDNMGNYVWARHLDRTSIIDMELDVNDNIYSTGHFYDSSNFNTDAGSFAYEFSSGNEDAFLHKLYPFGNFAWVRTFGGAGFEIPGDLSTSPAGDVFITGTYHDAVNFDRGQGNVTHTSKGGTDIFLNKYADDGSLSWSKSFGSGADDFFPRIDAKHPFGIYMAGTYDGIIDLDPGAGKYEMTHKSMSDIFTLLLNDNGEFQWAGTFGSSTNDNVLSITADPLGDLWLGGYFNGTMDFNPNGVSTPVVSVGNDGYIYHTGPCTGVQNSITLSSCRELIINGITYDSTGIYVQNLYTWEGCDSIVTINATIDQLDLTVTGQNGLTLSVAETGLDYQWLDCDDNFKPIANADQQTFTPTVYGNYAVAVYTGQCGDTSACYQSGLNSIRETNSEIHQIYPNPNQGSFSVKLSQPYPMATLKIYDQAGRLVQETTSENLQEVPVKISGAPGVYFLKIEIPDKATSMVKVIKE